MPTEVPDHQPLPVAGYTPQSSEKIALVNELKEAEERLHRLLDRLYDLPWADKRNVALARTALEDASMRAARSVFQPTRVKLPEDVQ